VTTGGGEGGRGAPRVARSDDVFRGAVPGPFALPGPYCTPLYTALCRDIPHAEHNYLIFLVPWTLCMIGDLGVISESY